MTNIPTRPGPPASHSPPESKTKRRRQRLALTTTHVAVAFKLLIVRARPSQRGAPRPPPHRNPSQAAAPACLPVSPPRVVRCRSRRALRAPRPGEHGGPNPKDPFPLPFLFTRRGEARNTQRRERAREIEPPPGPLALYLL